MLFLISALRSSARFFPKSLEFFRFFFCFKVEFGIEPWVLKISGLMLRFINEFWEYSAFCFINFFVRMLKY